MKYTKKIANFTVVKDKHKIIVYDNEKFIHNPSEELLKKHGWEIYAKNEQELLYLLKQEKVKLIKNYDVSVAINGFTINGIRVWLDKATRAFLMSRLQAEKQLGKEITCIWYKEHNFEMPVDKAIEILYQLEVYASECYDTTQRHIVNVQNLDNVEDVNNYDYKTDYPKMLSFNI